MVSEAALAAKTVAKTDIATWLAKQPKAATRAPLFNDKVFAPGEVSAAELWYVVDRCA